MIGIIITTIILIFLLLSLFAVMGLFLFDEIRTIWSPFHDGNDPKFSYEEYRTLGGKLDESRYPTICGKYVRLNLIDYFRVYHEEKRNNRLQARAKIIEEATQKKK